MGIEGLRGLAACSILVYHVWLYTEPRRHLVDFGSVIFSSGDDREMKGGPRAGCDPSPRISTPGSSIVPPALSTSARRASAAAVVVAETNLPRLCAAVVADALDRLAQAVLFAAGVDDPAVMRLVLDRMWADVQSG